MYVHRDNNYSTIMHAICISVVFCTLYDYYCTVYCLHSRIIFIIEEFASLCILYTLHACKYACLYFIRTDPYVRLVYYNYNNISFIIYIT